MTDPKLEDITPAVQDQLLSILRRTQMRYTPDHVGITQYDFDANQIRRDQLVEFARDLSTLVPHVKVSVSDEISWPRYTLTIESTVLE